MTDHYHWGLIETGVMPLDPELLAIGRVAHRALHGWDAELLDAMGVGTGIERLPLYVARALEGEDPRSMWRQPVPPEPRPALPRLLSRPESRR
jgi:hypothetical protein